MAFEVEGKLVVAIASSALFDLSESDAVYRAQGVEAYRKYQREHEEDVLPTGCAFPFIRRLLGLNRICAERQLVEVVLVSRNDPDTGLRVFNSIEHHKLEITRGAFLSGRSPYLHLPAFNACLFLSNNNDDVVEAIAHGHAAGRVLPTAFEDDPDDRELRIAFDFDGVLAGDEAERVFRDGGLAEFQKSEGRKAASPLQPGPLKRLFELLSDIGRLQSFERERKTGTGERKLLRTAIITARGAPAHKRVVLTLRQWGIVPDEVFFLGGMAKSRILKVFRPHIFFDDQRAHLEGAAESTPAVHIPFGIANEALRGQTKTY